MATIDSRLLPLIELLATGDADWLAFEILEGLRRGRVAEETQENLRIAQDLVRSRKPASRRTEMLAHPAPPTEQIVGEKQIDWVVAYMGERIVEIQSMLEATLGQLDEILLTPEERPIPVTYSDGVTLVLQTESGEYLSVRRDDAAHARTVLPKLRDGLLTWADSIRPRE